MKISLKTVSQWLVFAVFLCLSLISCQGEHSRNSRSEQVKTRDTLIDSARIEALKLNDTAVWIVQHHDVEHGNMDSLLYAVDLMSRACLADPTNSTMYAVKGQLLGLLKRYDQACRSYARACAISPTVPEYFVCFGAATEMSGNKQLAMHLYRHALFLFDQKYGKDNKTDISINRIVILMLLEEQFDMDETFCQIEGYDVNNKNSIPVLTHRMFDTITRSTILKNCF